MLTLDSLAFLQTPAGKRLLREAAEVRATSTGDLQTLTRLRSRHSPEAASAALETVALRERARRKFSLAGQMFFTRDALEQASGEVVAQHVAARFAGSSHVLDLCCGIGGDSIAIAANARVTAIDRDPLRLAIARINATVYGVADRITFLCADIIQSPLPAADAAYCDPGRRSDTGRIFDVRRYEPPLAAVLHIAAGLPACGIKVAPGIRDTDLPSSAGSEAEFIQQDGDLKQATLWLGRLRTTARRATLLPAGETLVSGACTSTVPVPALPPRRVLYEPAAAVIRAHLVEGLAGTLGSTKLDDSIAYLSGDTLVPTPFATAYAIEEWHPFNLQALRRRLRELGVGGVVVKKRGSPLDPQELERLLHLDARVDARVDTPADGRAASARRTLVLTHVIGRHAVLICSEHPLAR